MNAPAPSSPSLTWTLRRLGPADLAAYKALRDEGLVRHPDAFVSDVETEQALSPESYIVRLGLSDPLGGTFLLGAFDGKLLLGAVSLERESLHKLRHIANVSSMLVRPSHGGRGIGRALLQSCIDQASAATGLEMLTLTVSVSSTYAVKLYEHAGFQRYGLLPRAIRVAGPSGVEYFDKAYMVYYL